MKQLSRCTKPYGNSFAALDSVLPIGFVGPLTCRKLHFERAIKSCPEVQVALVRVKIVLKITTFNFELLI